MQYNLKGMTKAFDTNALGGGTGLSGRVSDRGASFKVITHKPAVSFTYGKRYTSMGIPNRPLMLVLHGDLSKGFQSSSKMEAKHISDPFELQCCCFLLKFHQT